MKIIRFITQQGKEVMGCDWDGQTASLVEQHPDKSFSDTGERVDVVKILPRWSRRPLSASALITGVMQKRPARKFQNIRLFL